MRSHSMMRVRLTTRLPMTIRRTIIDLLEGGPLTLRELALSLGLRESEVLDHLQHIARSIAPERRIQMTPARCRGCGFSFHKRTRFSTPSRCPRCRSQRIQPPELLIPAPRS